MVNLDVEQETRVFKALADPTRRGILEMVARKDVSAGELAAPFAMSAPAISKHLKILETAQLVTRVRDGQTHRFYLNVDSLQLAEERIRRLTGFWNQRLGNLEKYIESKQKEESE